MDTCFNCGELASETYPRLIVYNQQGGGWDFATKDEINGDLEKLHEENFCEECLREFDKF